MDVAQKSDMDAGFAELRAVNVEIRADMAAGFAKVDAGFVELRANMDAGFAELRAVNRLQDVSNFIVATTHTHEDGTPCTYTVTLPGLRRVLRNQLGVRCRVSAGGLSWTLVTTDIDDVEILVFKKSFTYGELGFSKPVRFVELLPAKPGAESDVTCEASC